MSSTKERIFVAGDGGMVGSAILRHRQAKGGAELITRAHADLDLADQKAVNDFFAAERPDKV